MSAELAGSLAAAVAVTAALLATRAGGLSPRIGLPHPDRAALEDVRWPAGLLRWEGLRAAMAASAVVLSAAAGLPLALAGAAAVAPSVGVHLRAAAARERARRALLPMLVAAEAALRSGASLPDALRRAVGAVDDAIATRPLAGALRSFDLGSGLDAALSAAADRSPDLRARAALGTLSLGVSERLPRERLGDLLSAIVDRLAFEESVADEVRARAAGARQQQRIIALLVPGIAAYLVVTMPTLGSTLSSDLGRFVLLPAAAALEIGGVVLSGRVVSDAVR